MSQFQGARILLGVSGGISAFKAVELLRLLTKGGAVVDVVMTESATRFVGAETFRALSGRPVLVHLFPPAEQAAEAAVMPHLEPAEAADLAIVAPATANTLAKMAYGIADNALTTTLLSVTAPVVVAPAMDSDMWRHPATQANVEILRSRGVHFVGPLTGELARRNVGPGRLAEPEQIAEEAAAVLQRRCHRPAVAGRHIVVTAGGTREPIDPVRYVSNRSSGKMGFAVAREALAAGARVTLIAAPTSLLPPAGCEYVPVETALEMRDQVLARLEACDVVVMAAAVADWRAETVSERKVKKGEADRWTITLVKNPDIAAEVGARKRPGQVLVAFAAETDELIENAAKKLRSKNADLVVANDVSRTDIGFGSDENEVILLFADGRRESLSRRSKEDVAVEILRRVGELLGD